MKQIAKETRIRKHNDILSVAGYGVIIFIIWAFIKGVIYLRWLIPNNPELEREIYSIGYISITVVEILISISTGWLARKTGRSLNKKPSIVLIVLSAILLLFAIYCISVDLYFTIIDKDFSVVSIIAIIADLLFFGLVLQILVSCLVLRKLYCVEKEAN